MREELHPLRYHYEGVQPYVKVTAYELSSVDCSSDKNSGYYGETATLTANEAPAGYNFSGWNITGSNMTGNSFRFQGDVTAKANYSAIQYNVTLQNDGNGIIAANKTTGNIGDTITLSNTANSNYGFSGYSITGSTLTGNTFNIGTSDVTAKAWFSAIPSYTLTLQTDGHGTLTATKVTGYAGDTVTLTPTYNTYYRFNNYNNTGGSINGNTFTFGAANATAKANFKVNYFTAVGTFNTASTRAYSTPTCTSTGKITSLTGSIPASWGSVNNSFSPSNASAFKITASCQARVILFDYSKDVTAGILMGNTVIASKTNWASKSTPQVLATASANGATAQGKLTFSGRGYNNSQTFSVSIEPVNNWTATGIAP